MGLRSTLAGADPVQRAIRAVQSAEDKERRREAKVRVDLYLGWTKPHIRAEINAIFKRPEVRERIEPFLDLAGAINLFRRVVDEIARPVYATPPVRRVSPDDAVYQALVESSRLNEKQDLSCRLLGACNLVLQVYTWSQRLGPVLQVITPDQFTMLTDPDDPIRPIAYIYDVNLGDGEGYTYIDDTETFSFYRDGRVLRAPVRHGYGMMPAVLIRGREAWQDPYDRHAGQDLVNAQKAIGVIMALVLKLHKSQGFRQLYIQGDLAGTPKGQPLDEESSIALPEGTTLGTVDLKSDASHYTDTIQRIIDQAAAAYGISRERLNQTVTTTADEAGLLERRADSIKTFRRAEREAFEVLKRLSLSAADPAARMSPNARLVRCDFAEISDHMDKRTLLEIWDKQQSMGLRNPLDNIKALNPEIETDAQAAEELDRNLEVTSQWVERMRALNQPKDATTESPGQSPERNGAMGPAVRDGDMTRDEAATKAGNGSE